MKHGSERREKIAELCFAVREFAPDNRAAFLDAACGSDVELRREIESLLAYEGLPIMIPGQPAWQSLLGELAEDSAVALSGQQVGRYRIEAQIGSGGMGEVYRAWDENTRRRVALKTL